MVALVIWLIGLLRELVYKKTLLLTLCLKENADYVSFVSLDVHELPLAFDE